MNCTPEAPNGLKRITLAPQLLNMVTGEPAGCRTSPLPRRVRWRFSGDGAPTRHQQSRAQATRGPPC